MPLPAPQADDTHASFVARCMSDVVMVSEFADTDQRLAVCESIWADATRGGHSNDERRTADISRLEVRADELDRATVRGHAALFHSLSEPLGGFRERIAPGAFSSSIERDDIRALINHDANLILARNRAGTLRLAEDADGLAVEFDLPPTSYAADLRASLERGDVSQMSFGFRVDPGGDEWQYDNDLRTDVRTLRSVSLFDVSAVTFPAYPQTHVALRSLLAARQHRARRMAPPLDVLRRKLQLEEMI